MSGRINYKEFAEEFQNSGLSRKVFGQRLGMSAQMVGYYLKRAAGRSANGKSQFQALEIINSTPSSTQVIKITTLQGTRIEIPLF